VSSGRGVAICRFGLKAVVGVVPEDPPWKFSKRRDLGSRPARRKNGNSRPTGSKFVGILSTIFAHLSYQLSKVIHPTGSPEPRLRLDARALQSRAVISLMDKLSHCYFFRWTLPAVEMTRTFLPVGAPHRSEAVAQLAR
jgi:hypothetical protein